MISRLALPMLALALPLSGCVKPPPQPIKAVAETRQCPAFPIPPASLMQRPAKIDFLEPVLEPGTP